MKRWGWIVLLVSLGLNLGFGIRLVGARREAAAPGSVPPWHDARFGDAERGRSGSDDTTGRAGRFGAGRRTGRAGRGGGRPALTDSAAWADFAQHRFERLADRLELQDAQRNRFAAVHHEGSRQVREQGLHVHEARLRLHDLYRADHLAEDAIRRAVADLAVAQARMDSLVAEVLIAELELLDPDQRACYLDLIPWEQRHGQASGATRGHDRRPTR